MKLIKTKCPEPIKVNDAALPTNLLPFVFVMVAALCLSVPGNQPLDHV